MDISIWPGSSSFYPSRTPWGFYDNDYAFQVDADRFANWCAKRLGYPIVDIELQDINFYAALEEAVTEYTTQVNQFNIKENLLTMQGSSTAVNLTQRNITPNFSRIIEISEMYATEANVGGDVTWHTGSINVRSGQSVYNLNELWANVSESGNAIEIRRIFHDQPPAISRFYDPMIGTGTDMNNMLNEFGWGNMSVAISYTMMPVYADLLRVQAIEFNDQIRKSAFSFEIHNNELRLFPLPQYDYKLWFHYILKQDRANPFKGYPSGSATGSLISDFSNIPYDRMQYSNINHVGQAWIWKYGYACALESLGFVRNKYGSIPLANGSGDMTLTDMRADGKELKDKLVEQLRTDLEETSLQKQMEKKQGVSDAVNAALLKVPLKIYIGNFLICLLSYATMCNL